MGFIVSIREVRHVEVPVQDDRRGPVVFARRRREETLPPEAWHRLLHFRVALPMHRSAGPCGTSVRGTSTAGALAWSIQHLIDPLAAYYATYEPPLRFGAKSTPRGRRVA